MRARFVPAPVALATLATAAGLVLLAAPAAAAPSVVTVQLTSAGPRPALASAPVGARVRFVNADPALVHAARSTSANWSFRTGPLAPGQAFTTGSLPAPGQYRYGGDGLDSFSGSVTVAAAPASPTPTGTTSPPVGPSRPPAAGPGAGGSTPPAPRTAAAAGVPLGSTPSGAAPPVAPVAPVAPPSPSTRPSPGGEATALAVSGPLPGQPSHRGLGLPATLAAVAALGVASLVVRLLLAEPSGRHASSNRRRW